VVLIALARRFGGGIHPGNAAFAILGGMVVWSFLEYAIHRFILHNRSLFAQDHDAHHAEPKALIGTPTWLTLLLMIAGIYLPASYLLHPGLGLTFGFGVTLGYLVYSFAHYSLHHWNFSDIGLLYRWKRLHALHHFAGPEGNFGVTSSLWDHVFGTALRKKRGGNLGIR
jgi:sterol desaturase/sphingolipid hydroxylase (fatty acid hydroxylase superfamily)